MIEEVFDKLFNPPKQKEPAIDDISETLPPIKSDLQKLRKLTIITD